MKNLVKKLTIWLLGIALVMGTTLSFVACVNTDNPEQPPAEQTNPSDSDKGDTGTGSGDETDKKDPSSGDKDSDGDKKDETGDNTDGDNTGDNTGDNKDDNTSDDKKDEETGDDEQDKRFFPLAYIGEALAAKTEYKILSIYEKVYKEDHYLAFYGIKNNQVDDVLTTIKIDDYKLNNEAEIDLQSISDTIDGLELKVSYQPMDSFTITQFSTENENKDLVESVIEVTAGQDYQIIFATMSNPVQAIVDPELGNNSRILINAILLKDGSIYLYSNTVQVATDAFDSAFDALLSNAPKKESETFNPLGNLAVNYQKSVDDKAAYDKHDNTGDKQQDERFFPLAYMGEKIEELYGYEVLGFFEFKNTKTNALYLAFVSEIFKPEYELDSRRVSRVILDIRLEDHRLADIIALENAPTQDAAKVKELKTFLESEFSAKKNISNFTYYEAYLSGSDHLTETDREYTERVLKVVLAPYAEKLGNYKIIYGCVYKAMNSANLEQTWGNSLDINISALILSEDNTVYTYENTVLVPQNYESLKVETACDCILLKEKNINAYKDYLPEDALTELISGVFAEEYQKSVDDKAKYEEQKVEQAEQATSAN